MYVGIDVGGTKTLVASLTNKGVIKHSERFPTPHDYDEFLAQLLTTIHMLPEHDFKAGGIGIPGTEMDRKHGIGVTFGNLPWRNVKVQQDVSRLTRCPIAFENDAKLGGLSEALLRPKAGKVLYVTIGTGIGIAFIDNGTIDVSIGDGGGRTMMIEWQGAMRPWETFASGHAIYERFGQKASDIDDDKTWQIIAHDISLGLVELIALTEPDLVVIGGGIGTHYHKYGPHLERMLHQLSHDNPLLQIPPIEPAQRPEVAVVYGAFELARRLHDG
jgi:predicted NBD/HSP70 family sugar kinase